MKTKTNDELYHFGIKGMKWGVRRYENEDGTLTPEGKKRYRVTERSSKKQIKKAIEKHSKANFNEVGQRYEKSLASNKKLNDYLDRQKEIYSQCNFEYAKAYNRLASMHGVEDGYSNSFNVKEFDIHEHALNDIDPDIDSEIWSGKYTMTDNLFNLLNENDRIVAESDKEVARVARSFVDEFDNARLKDLDYEGTFESGRKILDTYGGAEVRSDGYISTKGSFFPRDGYYPSSYYNKRKYDRYMDL